MTARVNHVLVALSQNDQPVAQKMRTGRLYSEQCVLGKIYWIVLFLFKARHILLFQFLL